MARHGLAGQHGVVMRLDRLAALVAVVDLRGGGPLIHAAAGRWGLAGDSARYVRTSATCVYAVDGGYLRLGPLADRPLESVRAAASVTAALARDGAPVVAPRPSTAGRLVEVVASGVPGVGDVSAMLVDAAPGSGRELEDLTRPDIERWGHAVGSCTRSVGESIDRSCRTGRRSCRLRWPDAGTLAWPGR